MTLTAEQRANRACALGGSDCAAALGLSRFKTARELYHQKRGELPVELEETEWMEFGRFIEPYVRQRYAQMTGRTVRLPTGTLRHPEFPWMVAHVDGFSQDQQEFRGYEGKWIVIPRGYGEEGTDEVPLDALLQCQHYTLVTGWPVFDVATLAMGGKVKLYEVKADEEMQQMIIDGEREFMRCVAAGEPPALDYEHRTALDLLKRIYPGTDGRRVLADATCQLVRTEMEEATSIEKQAKATKNVYRAKLLDFMGEAALLVFADGRSFRRMRIDKEAYTVEASSYIDTRIIKTPH